MKADREDLVNDILKLVASYYPVVTREFTGLCRDLRKLLEERPPFQLELNEDLRNILGRPSFTLIDIANLLRADGMEIPRKAEEEQAYVLHWMLNLYFEHGEQRWHEVGQERLSRIHQRVK